jgi:hypothetical protein
MLINTYTLIDNGVEPTTAAKYISMLNRVLPSKTLKVIRSTKSIETRGRISTKNFDLNSAISIALEYKNSKYHNVNTDIWADMLEALLAVPYVDK